MNEERLLSVLLAPHVSEKSSYASGDYRQYAFRVAPDATKIEIRDAVEHLFSVKVRNVRTNNVKGKVKRFGRTLGKRSGWKKAYVSLAAGHEIDAGGKE